jgi:hypothetical protein
MDNAGLYPKKEKNQYDTNAGWSRFDADVGSNPEADSQ